MHELWSYFIFQRWHSLKSHWNTKKLKAHGSFLKLKIGLILPWRKKGLLSNFLLYRFRLLSGQVIFTFISISGQVSFGWRRKYNPKRSQVTASVPTEVERFEKKPQEPSPRVCRYFNGEKKVRFYFLFEVRVIRGRWPLVQFCGNFFRTFGIIWKFWNFWKFL